MPTLLQNQSQRREYICYPDRLEFSILLLWMCTITIGCKSIIPPEQFEFIVRDGSNLELLDSATIRISRDGILLTQLTTDEKGYAAQSARKANLMEDFLRYSPEGYQLVWSKDFASPSGMVTVSDTVSLNRYLPVYELYLLPPGKQSISVISNPECPTADMHYHVSMRTHNHFGKWLYDPVDPFDIPDNLNWYKSYKKLRVLYTSPKGKTEIRRIKPGDMTRKNERKLHTILDQKWVYAPVGASNKFTEFTQATHPHVAEGNVRLAYNAISPFEQATSNNWRNRLAGSLFVTGANQDWLKRIGGVKNGMTHWQNFNFEYYNITRQSTSYNHFTYRFLRHDTDWDADVPTIVTVLEGSHVFQDSLFPQLINFNIGKATFDQHVDILHRILDHHFPVHPDSSRHSTDAARKQFVDNVIGVKPYDKTGNSFQDVEYSDRNLRRFLIDTSLATFVENELKGELIRNIDSLKRMNPPICMVTISHLAYNGMSGHTVGWDQGRGLNNLIARRNYGIRVSDDKGYKSQWERNFYSIPGVNQYGRVVMDKLISTDNNTHRIMIDLKHADLTTRKFFFDSVMIQRKIPPICSHCGVNGLSVRYGSPLVNEYYLTKAHFVKTLYPFAINLYDEEIRQICQNEGIIGIPLEQRILGGYVNKRDERTHFIDRKGEYKPDIVRKSRRWTYTKRYLTHLVGAEDDHLMDAVRYVRDSMGVKECPGSTPRKKYKHILKMIQRDYISAEPFLYNVFHVVDQCGIGYEGNPWKHICIGSDLDGLIDPIDMMPTASQYPQFREKLKMYIPVFLKLRRLMDPGKQEFEHYFHHEAEVDHALEYLFYKSLYDFTYNNMLKKNLPL